MTRFSLIGMTFVTLTCLTCSSRAHVLRKPSLVAYTNQIENLCPCSSVEKPQGYFGPSQSCYPIGEQGPCSVDQMVSLRDGIYEAICVNRSQPGPPSSIWNVLKSTGKSDNVLDTRVYHAVDGIGANRCREGEVYDHELQTCL